MIPDKSDPRWGKIVKGEIEHEFKLVPAGLLLSVMKRQLQQDKTDINLAKFVDKLHGFFERFELLLQDDIEVLFSGAAPASKPAASVVSRSSNMLLSITDTIKMIQDGEVLFIAGDEGALSLLPKGKWVGGTIPYFMSENGGLSTKSKLFVTRVADYSKNFNIKFYDEKGIEALISEMPDHGFSYIIIPAESKMHIAYAQHAPNHQNLFMKPIIGWISGVNVNDLGRVKPKVYNGVTQESSADKAVVMHVNLPPEKIATIGIINIFRQGKGDSIKFLEDGFSAKNCIINGQNVNFADYMMNNKVDIKLPLVANYSGTMVNVSFQSVDEKEKAVHFYAPVFKGVEYKLAMPVTDYISAFMNHLPDDRITPLFACNCILNYLYSQLEGKKTGNITGPVTFGEIAYQLLNQTLTYLEIKSRS